MARYRTYTIEFKRQLVEEHLSGGAGLSELARRHDISRELLRTWARKHEAGEPAGGRPRSPDRRACEAEIAGLEREVGRLTVGPDLPERGLRSARCQSASNQDPGSASKRDPPAAVFGAAGAEADAAKPSGLSAAASASSPARRRPGRMLLPALRREP